MQTMGMDTVSNDNGGGGGRGVRLKTPKESHDDKKKIKKAPHPGVKNIVPVKTLEES